jgi:hypothetical protein
MTARNLRCWMCATALVFTACSADTTRHDSQDVGLSQSQQSQEQLGVQNPSSASSWLDELNRLRKTGGLRPVAENAALTRDCDAHAQYLVEQGPATEPQFEAYKSAIGLGAHHEDPASPDYSAAGAECAAGGKEAMGVSQSNDVAWGRDPINDLDGLFYDAVSSAVSSGSMGYCRRLWDLRQVSPAGRHFGSARRGRHRLAPDSLPYRRQHSSGRTSA